MIKPYDNQVKGDYSKAKNLKWKEPFYFIQAADTQYGLIRRKQYIDEGKIDGEIKEWEEEKKLSAKAVELINQMIPAPKFMIICGDMLDQFPYELKNKDNLMANYDGIMSDELSKTRLNQYEDFINIFQKLRIPLVCLCGNHDVGDKPTIKSLERYETEFGDNYFKFYLDGVLFVCLNSQLFYDAHELKKVAEEQEKWLDEILNEEVKLFKHAVILQHHPLFIKDVNEENNYFNIPIIERKKILEKFKKAGIKKVFTGHLHKNASAFDEDLENVVTGAIGLQIGSENQHGFRVVKIEDTEIKHKYYTLQECPKNLDL